MTTRDQAAATAGSAVIASRVALMTAAITTRSQRKVWGQACNIAIHESAGQVFNDNV